MNKPKADLTPEELEEREKHEFQTGPLSANGFIILIYQDELWYDPEQMAQESPLELDSYNNPFGVSFESIWVKSEN